MVGVTVYCCVAGVELAGGGDSQWLKLWYRVGFVFGAGKHGGNTGSGHW